MNNLKHLMLAEDDAEDAEIFREVLKELAVPVSLSVAANGLVLMKLLQEAEPPPDFIFLDLNMPLKNGMQCLQEIRANEQWKGVRVVVLSTSAHTGTIAEAYKQGADDYLTKFTSYAEFKSALAACLQRIWPAQ